MGEYQRVIKDRAYTHDEIKMLVDAADLHMKVIPGRVMNAIGHMMKRQRNMLGTPSLRAKYKGIFFIKSSSIVESKVSNDKDIIVFMTP